MRLKDMQGTRALVLVLGLALVAASCGSDSVADPTSTTVTSTPTTLAASTTTPPPTAVVPDPPQVSQPEARPLFPDQVALPLAVWIAGTTYDLSQVPAPEIWAASLRPPVFTPSGVAAVMAVDGGPALIFFPADGADPLVLSDSLGLPGSIGGFGGFAVTDDGSRIAWSETSDQEVEGARWPTLLVEAALPSGQILNSTVFTGFDFGEGRPTNGFAVVVGYAGNNVVLGTGDGAQATAAVWIPEQDAFHQADGYGSAVSQRLTGNRAVLNQGDGPCAVLVTIGPRGTVDPPEGKPLDCSAWMSPTESPDGSLIALGGDGLPDGEPFVLIASGDGEEFLRMPIVGVPDFRSFVWDLVWMDDLTVLALVGVQGNGLGRDPWMADWAIYQCDLDDTGCHLAQSINFEPTDWYQVALVDLH